MVKNALNWFEIPVSNFERARELYSTILGEDVPTREMGGFLMGFLPYDQMQGIGGAIVKGEDYVHSKNGALIYLNGGDNLETVLNRVEGAGGEISTPKTLISDEIVYFAIFIDPEGNKMGLHSMH